MIDAESKFKRMAELAMDYAQCYVDQTDAPEGVKGAIELHALARSLLHPETRIKVWRDDSGKANNEIT